MKTKRSERDRVRGKHIKPTAEPWGKPDAATLLPQREEGLAQEMRDHAYEEAAAAEE